MNMKPLAQAPRLLVGLIRGTMQARRLRYRGGLA